MLSPRLSLASDRNLLYISMKNKDENQVVGLLRRIPDINQLDSTGLAIIHVAVQSRSTDMVRLVVDAKADVNITSTVRNGGFGPLHLAIQQNNYTMANALIEMRANPNLPSYKGVTPVHECAKFSTIQMLRMLLAAGGNGAQKDSYGFVPYTYANKAGNYELSKLLPQIQTDHWAHIKAQPEFKERLLNYKPTGGKKKKGKKKK